VDGVSSKSGRTKVDGWIKQSNTILEFHGDYYHGNPNKYDADQWNETTKCTFGDLYESTMERMDNLKTMGYNVIYIWEGDYKKWKKNDVAFSDLPTHHLA
jgi:hypothetical protein